MAKKMSRLQICKYIWPYLRSVRGAAAGLFLSRAAAIPAALISPLFFEILVDDVMRDRRFELFYIVVLGLLGVYLLRLLVDGSAMLCNNRMLNRFTITTKEKIWKHYCRMPYSVYERMDPGDLQLRLTEDVDRLGNFIGDQVVDVWFYLVQGGCCLAIALMIEPQMTLCCLPIVPIVFFLNYWIGRGAGKVNEELRGLGEQYTASTYESLWCWREIKVQNTEAVFISRFRAYRRQFAKLGLRSIRYWFYGEVFRDFKGNYLTSVLVYAVGAFFILAGSISVGTLIMYAQYFMLLFAALDALSEKSAALKANMPYYHRVFDTLSQKEEPQGANATDLDGRLQAQGLCFSYAPDAQVLSKATLTAKHGEILAVAGQSGCGKTTLIKVLAGLYPPSQGEVTYSDTPLEKLEPQQMYRQVGIVLQDGCLFDTTIAENLRMARPEATDGELMQACAQAGIASWILTLPKRLETKVGQQGSHLSGGQRQRLLLARVFLKKPQVILLDEATSALDQPGEMHIRHTLRHLPSLPSVVWVSHKPQTIAAADRIAVMENGRIR